MTRWLAFTLLAGVSSGNVVAGQAPVIRDSAGVRIVENRRLAEARVAYRIESRPTLVLGGLDTPQEFDARRGPGIFRRLTHRGFVSADGVRLRFWGSDGRLLRTVGRSGEGPGEFRNHARICELPDGRLLVFDRLVGRVSVLVDESEFHAFHPLAPETSSAGCLTDGSYVGFGHLVTENRGPAQVGYTTAYLVSLSGDTLVTFGRFRNRVMQLISPRLSAIAFGDRVFFSGQEAPEIQVYDRSGRLIQSIRTVDRVRSITAAEAREGHPSFLTVLNNRNGRLTAAGNPTVPRGNWPAFGRVRVAPDGLLWVEDGPRSVRPGWTAFGQNGTMLGRLAAVPEMGSEGTSVVFGAGEVFLYWKDNDGAPRLSVHALRRIG